MSLEKTTKELIFELGNRAQMFTLLKILGVDINEVEFRVQEPYDTFKITASLLGVRLPDLTEDTLCDQFIADQISTVERYISLYKTASMRHLYCTGKPAQSIELFFNKSTIQGHF